MPDEDMMHRHDTGRDEQFFMMRYLDEQLERELSASSIMNVLGEVALFKDIKFWMFCGLGTGKLHATWATKGVPEHEMSKDFLMNHKDAWVVNKSKRIAPKVFVDPTVGILLKKQKWRRRGGQPVVFGTLRPQRPALGDITSGVGAPARSGHKHRTKRHGSNSSSRSQTRTPSPKRKRSVSPRRGRKPRAAERKPSYSRTQSLSPSQSPSTKAPPQRLVLNNVMTLSDDTKPRRGRPVNLMKMSALESNSRSRSRSKSRTPSGSPSRSLSRSKSPAGKKPERLELHRHASVKGPDHTADPSPQKAATPKNVSSEGSTDVETPRGNSPVRSNGGNTSPTTPRCRRLLQLKKETEDAELHANA